MTEIVGRYRKKPVVIEAARVPTRVDDSIEAINAWVESILALEGWMQSIDCTVTRAGIHIPTLEGVMTAAPGDWIIRGVAGEFYPCKPDIFERTYEMVME